MSARTRRVLLYADVNLNILDGSSVWVQSMAQALSLTDSTVDVLLKAPVTVPRITDAVAALDGVRLVDPAEPRPRPRRTSRRHAPVPDDGVLSAHGAAARVLELDARERYDVVVARGREVCAALVAAGAVDGRLWPYMTDVPQTRAGMTGDVRGQLAAVARSARRLFAQTEDARSFLEHHVPEAAGKVVLLPPMVPPVPDGAAEDRHPAADGALSVVYAGKFAKAWRTLEMCDLPRRAAAHGVDVRLTMVGDKVQAAAGDRGWAVRMREALTADGVTWLGGLPRAEAVRELARHDVGMGWRAPELDASHELSTKLLEYAAAGVPPVLNRTAMHEELLGADYPLFVDDATVLTVLERAAREPEVLAAARAAVAGVAADFTVAAAARRLEAVLTRTGRVPAAVPRGVPESEPGGPPAGRRRVLVVGHDLKFAGELVDHLSRRDDVDLAFDHWASLRGHDAARSEELLAGADVVLCEFAGPNAVWYARHKRPGQRLVVRLHMFELRGPWLDDLDLDAVDELVCVSEHAARLTRERLGLPEDRVRVVPNVVDVADLARPKAAAARFHLGLVGIVPVLKRLDRALDLLELLRAEDPRFALHVRGRLPDEYPWEWRKPVVRAYYEEQFRRIASSPALAGAVSLDDFGPDVGSWLRKVGWVLSPSASESFHLAPVEGMASGAVPVAWERDGAADVLGARWVHADTRAAVDAVLAVVRDGRWDEESTAAADAAGRYDVDRVVPTWAALLGLA